MLYRKATVEDIEGLTNLRLLMQNEVNSNKETIDPKYIDSVKMYFKTSIKENSYVSIVAESDGSLIAAAGLIIYKKIPGLINKTGLTGYISNVYTIETHRRKGISTDLMQQLIIEAKRIGIEKLHLGTTQDGKGIYERLGFKEPKDLSLQLKL